MKENIKQKLDFIFEKVRDKKAMAIGSLSVAVPALLSVGVSAADTGTSSLTVPSIADNVTSEMLNGIVKQISDLLPVCLPTVVLLLGFRKGISFLMGMLRGA